MLKVVVPIEPVLQGQVGEDVGGLRYPHLMGRGRGSAFERSQWISFSFILELYRVSHLVVDLIWLTWNFIVPLSAQLSLGWWEFGRSGLAGGQSGGTLKS